MAENPTKVGLPGDLMNDILAEATYEDMKPHGLCVQMIKEGILRRKTRLGMLGNDSASNPKSGGSNGVFA